MFSTLPFLVNVREGVVNEFLEGVYCEAQQRNSFLGKNHSKIVHFGLEITGNSQYYN